MNMCECVCLCVCVDLTQWMTNKSCKEPKWVVSCLDTEYARICIHTFGLAIHIDMHTHIRSICVWICKFPIWKYIDRPYLVRLYPYSYFPWWNYEQIFIDIQISLKQMCEIHTHTHLHTDITSSEYIVFVRFFCFHSIKLLRMTSTKQNCKNCSV